MLRCSNELFLVCELLEDERGARVCIENAEPVDYEALCIFQLGKEGISDQLASHLPWWTGAFAQLFNTVNISLVVDSNKVEKKPTRAAKWASKTSLRLFSSLLNCLFGI